MVKITWLGHAAFLVEGDNLRILTDPYEPNEIINLPPITVPADVVIRSSDDDEAHSHVDTIPPGFELVTATEIVDTGAMVRGLQVEAVWAQESLEHKAVAGDNAMYRFALEGVHIAHMGDVGNPLSSRQMQALAGTDILLALAGGPPTIELEDLHRVVATVKPKVVIPMHYRIPGPRFFMLPVTGFTGHYPDSMVTWSDSSEAAFTRETLPGETRILVLQPALVEEGHP